MSRKRKKQSKKLGRPKTRHRIITLNDAVRKFFDVARDLEIVQRKKTAPPLLKELSVGCLAHFKKALRARGGISSLAGWFDYRQLESGTAEELKGALEQWGQQLNLEQPCMYDFALAILRNWATDPKALRYKWFPGQLPRRDYVRTLLEQPPFITIEINCTAPDVIIDRTPEGYIKRVRKEATELLERKLADGWDRAAREAADLEAQLRSGVARDLIQEPVTDDQVWEALIRNVCRREPFSDLAAEFNRTESALRKATRPLAHMLGLKTTSRGGARKKIF